MLRLQVRERASWYAADFHQLASDQRDSLPVPSGPFRDATGVGRERLSDRSPSPLRKSQ